MKMLNQVKITFASRSFNEGFAVRRGSVPCSA